MPYYDSFRKKSYNINYIISENPASNVFYSSGKNKSQIFSLAHSQKIDSVWSFSLNYVIINSPGLYLNQNAINSAFSGYVIKKSPDLKYYVIVGATMNKILQNENGGIENVNYLQDTALYDRMMANVNLSSAVRQYKDKELFFKQYYRITKNETKNPIFLGYDFNYDSQNNIYSDNSPVNEFYPAILSDSTITFDSTFVRRFTNTISLSNYIPFDSIYKKFIYNISFEQQNVLFSYLENKNKYNRQKFNIGFTNFFASSYILLSDFSFYIGKYNHNNFDGNLKILKKINNKIFNNIGFSTTICEYYPIKIFNSFNSNHYSWDNNFNSQKKSGLSIFTNTKLGNLNLNYFMLSNYVFFNVKSEVVQKNQQFGVFNIEYKGDFLFNNITINTDIGTNYVSDNTTFRLPEFYGLLSLGYEFPPINDVLKIFIGVEALYFKKFNADTWNPVTAMFNLQNDIEIGDYIYPSAFLAIGLKRSRIFAMLENVSSGMLGYNYYAMPLYPRNDMFFRWGVSWSFFLLI
jgi:hypothetical protein